MINIKISLPSGALCHRYTEQRQHGLNSEGASGYSPPTRTMQPQGSSDYSPMAQNSSDYSHTAQGSSADSPKQQRCSSRHSHAEDNLMNSPPEHSYAPRVIKLLVHSIVFRVGAFYFGTRPYKCCLGCDTLRPRCRADLRVGKTPLHRRPGRDLPQRDFTPDGSMRGA